MSGNAEAVPSKPDAAKKRLRQDLNATTKLLRKHGLLMDLPASTFFRRIGDEDPVKICEEQIRRCKESGTNMEIVEKKIEKIERLGQLSGGAEAAMHLLLDAADAYLAEDEYDEEADLDDALEKIEAMTYLMEKLICLRYREAREAEEEWDPGAVRDRIKQVRKKHDIASGAGYPLDWIDYTMLFLEPLSLLHLVAAAKVTDIMVGKVAGHKLPVELVDIIRDFARDDGALLQW